MSHYNRKQTIKQKYFARYYYRLFLTFCFVSVIISCILLVLIMYYYFQWSPVHFYASSSAGIITPLTPMVEPNETPNYLLIPDPVEEMGLKRLDSNKNR